ncbi:DUF2938 domain-containing protein [Lysobacter sp.]|uniref:DUF2938 domain-containing protein n=1 Tax=Lysobacter sp. TaxID=72226 RepID=UPI002D6AE8EB|nr:DUF2938 domain-containing protein [Lysobacter sp.]HZX78155.1 DUF2938 domain-containing protein [Lysobacter sp.]
MAPIEVIARTCLIGVGATTAMDVWALVRRRVFGLPALDYALVGRWLAWLPRGRVVHTPIAATPPVSGEGVIGWAAHYLIGVAFAAVLVALCGTAWLSDPTPVPAVIIGVASVVAPFFILQPALGAGIAACRTPRPWAARMHSVVTHTVFGVGLYASAWIVARLAA